MSATPSLQEARLLRAVEKIEEATRRLAEIGRRLEESRAPQPKPRRGLRIVGEERDDA